MTTTQERTALPRLTTLGIFGGLFCGYVGLTSVIPVLPGFVRERFSASDFAVGLVVTGTALTALVVRPLSGHLADRRGHRLVMQAGALIVAIGGALYFVPLGLVGLVVVRLLLGVGEASLFTAGAVWTVSIAPHDRRAQLIGLYGVSMWGGISVGTFLGAALQHYGYDAVWGFSAGAAVLALVLISVVPEPVRHAQPSEQKGGATRASVLLPRTAVLPGVALALAAAGYAGLAAFVVLHLKARGIHSGVVVLSGYSAVYAGTRLFIGRLPDRLGPRRVAAWCGIGEAAGLLIIAVAPNLPIAVAGSVIMGAGFSLLHPSLALMVLNRTEAARQGAAIGAYTSFWDLGLAVWGPLVGVVAAGFGYPAVFVTGSICAAAATVLALGIRRPEPVPAAAG